MYAVLLKNTKCMCFSVTSDYKEPMQSRLGRAMGIMLMCASANLRELGGVRVSFT